VTQSRTGVVTFLEICLLALWLGASLFFAAVVAPAAFDVLPTPGLAGALVGRTLPWLFISGLIVGAVVMALEIRAPRPGGRVRAVGAGVMLLACAIAQFVIGRQIERLRREAGTPIGALSQEDPRRRAFGRLHALSVAALGMAMVAAVAAAVASRSTEAAS
jgi:uncharacterized membrane protein